MKLKVEDRKQRHGSIEVLLSFVEIEVHDTEVDFQFSRVLLLFQKLHLSFNFLLSLLTLKLFLCLSSILFFLLVLLLFFVIIEFLLGF